MSTPPHPRRRNAQAPSAILFTCFWMSPAPADELTLRSYAGHTVERVAIDGPRLSARFGGPTGVAMDAQGNIWVADNGAAVVRRISSLGDVSTAAGLAGQRDIRDGIGAAARFRQPFAVAVDASGSAWIADDSAIRRVSTTGKVVTVAGGPDSGSADGSGSAAHFFDARALAIDPAGYAWVADSGNQTIRRVSPSGEVVTIAGLAGQGGSANGQGSNARFLYPNGIAFDGSGNAWVTDSDKIRKVTPGGFVTTLTLTGFAGAFDRFHSLYGIAVEANGNLVVADQENAIVARVTQAGQVTLLTGGPGSQTALDGSLLAARFRFPVGVSRGPSDSLLVADNGNAAIRRIGADNLVTTFSGGPIPAAGAPALDAFEQPEGLAADTHGNVWIADTLHGQVRRIAPDGSTTLTIGASDPAGVAVDAADNVWFVDRGLHIVRRRTAAGVLTTIAGSAGNSGSANGTGADARFRRPHGIALDAAGNAWVADTDNFTIRKVTPAGEVTTIAGAAGLSDSVDGDGSAARFSVPYGISMDETGLLWVGDGNAVRTVTQAGHVATVPVGPSWPVSFTGSLAARGGAAFLVDSEKQSVFRVTAARVISQVAGGGPALHASGTGMVAGLLFPQAIAVDGAGTVFVADSSALFRSTPTLPDRATVNRPIGVVGQPYALSATPYLGSTTQWSISRRPIGSQAAPLFPTSQTTSVYPDVADIWEARLVDTGPAGESLSTVSFRAVSRGDLNADSELNVLDVVTLAGHIVGNIPPGVAPFLAPREAADVNNDSAYDVFDVVILQAVIVGNATIP